METFAKDAAFGRQQPVWRVVAVGPASTANAFPPRVRALPSAQVSDTSNDVRLKQPKKKGTSCVAST
ncbi:hypothetical protein [Secundilactobacillus odoratitofui]|uniref:hypothetical protein n=1 Tax=Secundilactobacillus odoratitofui TaxID=480930 RepID=UPI0020928E63|nr:hypothetical protein [Secundilactobacillus odoratitofui]